MAFILRFVIAFIIISMIGIAAPVMAGDISEIWEIYSEVPEDYSDYAFKFTYLGSQLSIVPTAGGHGFNRVFDVDDFKPYHRDYHYKNDDIYVNAVIPLSNQEFKDFVDAIAGNENLLDTKDVDDPNTSFMIIRDYGSETRCWEHLAIRSETKQLYDLLIDSLDQARGKEIELLKKCKRHMGGS